MSISASASWEIDFFGRIRSLKDRALEEYLATDQARRSAQILLVSAVATAYLTLAADRENLKLATSTLETQEASYKLIRKRHDVGLASELDLRRAQSQVDTARGDVARYTQLAAQDENALNLLVGSPLPQALLPSDLSSVNPPKEISPGLSSEVLLHRPDVLAAEHRLKAANANIGAARAAFFPRISLTTAIGTASADLSGLFKSGSGTWSFAPQIAIADFRCPHLVGLRCHESGEGNIRGPIRKGDPDRLPGSGRCPGRAGHSEPADRCAAITGRRCCGNLPPLQCALYTRELTATWASSMPNVPSMRRNRD